MTGKEPARSLALGVRVSPHPFVLDILMALEEPLLSTRANVSATPPSTVVDCTGPGPHLLRERGLSLQKLSSPTEIVHG